MSLGMPSGHWALGIGRSGKSARHSAFGILHSALSVRHSRSRGGFTYAEMLVILAIVAIMASVVVPSFVSMKRGRDARMFKMRLRDMATNARARAVHDAHTVTLRFDKSNATIYDTEELDNGTQTTLDKLKLPQDVTPARFGADQYEAADGDWRVPFYPDGTTAGGGIEFEAGSDKFSIVISRNDARTMVTRGPLPDPGSDRWPAGGYERR